MRPFLTSSGGRKRIAACVASPYCRRVAVKLTILGSGSAGNCAYLETDETRLLIDAGLSGRQIRERLASIGRTPELLHGILITHEHSDHVQGLTTLSAKLRIFRAPEFLGTAFLLAVLAMLVNLLLGS